MRPWPIRPLGELATTVMGQAPPGRECNLGGKGTPFVKAGEFGASRPLIREWTTKPLKLAKSSDVLVCVVGATCGKLNLGADCAIGRSVAAIRPDKQLLNQQFLYAFLQGWTLRLRSGSQGSAQGVITRDMLESIPLPVPPLAEQERLVELLDEADEMRKLRAKADRRTADLIPALFHEMFDNSHVKQVPVGELTLLVTSGATPRGGDEIYVSDGPYFIRSQNVRMNNLDLSGAVCLPAEVHKKMARTKVAQGDVLLNITGASIGRVAWVDKLEREANVSQHVCLIRPKPDLLNGVYLSVFISLPSTQHRILQVQAGASRQALNHQQVRALEIPLPPMPVQIEFATRVTEMRALEAEQAASRRRIDDLFQSMLHGAFSGKL